MRLETRTPRASSQEASARMRANRSRDTKPEKALRSALHRRGLRFRLNRRIVPGTTRSVDIVFQGARVAVLVDGCYWHGCPQHGTRAKANSEFWQEKIATNKRRDADTNRRLRKAGWSAIRVWEHEDPAVAARRIARLVRPRR